MDPRDTKFYIGKLNANMVFNKGTAIDYITGQPVKNDNKYSSNKYSLQKDENVVISIKPEEGWHVFYYDATGKFILDYSIASYNDIFVLYKPDNAAYFAIQFEATDSVFIENKDKGFVYLVHNTMPHYKKLTKEYKKESGQQFFRESIAGDITLVGGDYIKLYNYTLEDKGIFIISMSASNKYTGLNKYNLSIAYSISVFSKTDITFNNSKNNCSIKLNSYDNYQDILDGYKNKYDVIKLSPRITRVELYKRPVMQVYVQGSNSIVNIAGEMSFNTAVSEDDLTDTQLVTDYHFSICLYLEEVMVPYDKAVESRYPGVSGRYCGKYGVLSHENGKYQLLNASPNNPDTYNYWHIKRLSDNKIIGTSKAMWQYSGIDTSTIDNNKYSKECCVLGLSKGNGGQYFTNDGMLMDFEEANATIHILQNEEFLYPVFCRILTDADSYSGAIMYKIAPDDPFINGSTYKRCFGAKLNDECVISLQKSDSPTMYGMDEGGKYFTRYYTVGQRPPIAIGTSMWAYASVWFKISERVEQYLWGSKVRYTLKNAYSIGHIIKVLLQKIAPYIKHEPTSEYSEFLYGDTMPLKELNIDKFYVYITPKSNILKGDYDMAARKGELSLEELMNMLRDCFKCYWYLDGNKLKIEHISYFINGGSYSPTANKVINLTKEIDKFNNKNVLYGQEAISYDTSSISNRYEFGWMDNATWLFTGPSLNVKNEYVQSGNKEEVSISNFSADIDYMLANPVDISSDGFALLCPIKSGANKYHVPLTFTRIKDDTGYIFGINIQNYHASLAFLQWLYMYDISGNMVDSDIVPEIIAHDVLKCMTQEISFIWPYTVDPDIMSLIKTNIGEGQIEELSIDVDSRVIKAKLVFSPA